MVEILIILMHDVIQCLAMFYCFDKLLGEKIKYNSVKTLFSVIIFAVLIRFNWLYNNGYVTTLFSYTLICGTNYYIRKNQNINSIVSATVVDFIVTIIGELLMSLILMIFMSNEEIMNLTSHPIYKNLISLSIHISTIFVIQLPFFKILYNKLSVLISKMKIVFVLLVFLFFALTFNLTYAIIFYNDKSTIQLVVNFLFLFIYSVILIKSLNTNIKYKEISVKYSNTIDALKDYEKMIDFYKVNNHENKNNFLTIRNMLGDDNQNIKNFIDNIIDNRIMDDEKLNMESSNIPEGGIRAVIYSKLLEMKSKKIKFDLEADFKVRRFSLDNSKDKTMLDICNILGVFLDNAIHESINLKDKAYIKVSLTIKNSDLYISVKNKFKGTLDLKEIDKAGYTTKGDGHGYGLSLVKNILSENKQLENKRKVTKSTFEQILVIKANKNSAK